MPALSKDQPTEPQHPSNLKVFLQHSISWGAEDLHSPNSGSEQDSSGGSHDLRLKVSEIFQTLGVIMSCT